MQTSNGAKKILVFYAKSGFLGHKVIADDYANLFKQAGFEVVEGDVFAIDGRAIIKGGTKLYLWSIKVIPWLWRFLYENWTHLPGAKWFKNYWQPTRYPKTQQFILEQKPDLIVTTHPTATSIVNLLKKSKKYTGPLFTTFSDWHTQLFHVHKYVDKYFVVTPEEKQDVLRLGFRDEQVIVPGILVSEKYYQAPSKAEARQQLKLETNRKIILLMGGGQGWKVEETIQALWQLRTQSLVIIVGGSDDRKKELEKFIAFGLRPTQEVKTQFILTGFVEPSLFFAASDLLISKPGGLTTSQAFLLKLPLLVISPLPGQEDLNVEYLLKKQAIIVGDKDKFTEQVDELLANEGKLKQIAENAYKLAPINAPKIILDEIKKALII